jgi:hypothetical protein
MVSNLASVPEVSAVDVVAPMTEPFSSMVALVWARPAFTVSLALSLENMPVDRAAKAKTEDTTTNAINTIAVSRPVIPFSFFDAIIIAFTNRLGYFM